MCEISGQRCHTIFIIMFSYVYNVLKLKIILFLLPCQTCCSTFGSLALQTDNVGKDDVRGIQLFEVYNLTATCHLMLHTGPLRLHINRV